MIHLIYIIVVFLIILAICPKYTSKKLIIFNDKNFENVIREHIVKPNGDIYKTDVLKIKILNASSRKISNINGIEHLTNLELLYLDNNDITDISPLFNCNNIFRFPKIKRSSKIYYGTMSYVESISPFCIERNKIPDWQIQKYKPILDKHFNEDFYFGFQHSLENSISKE